ncbi:M16 family metallopeptidase, partial [Pontibaca methylaminivorans]|uniref:M16 family metallopeptidase n=1 Tax=Pontibaca methylaminivorans TaxID=515897 RepID=UPI002FD96FE9
DDLLGDLPETGAPLPPPAKVADEGGTVVVDYDTPQSVAVFGQEGLERDDPDFYAAYVLNQILGGGSFESRLMQELRVKRGLTYGVYTYLAPKDLAALYMGGVASANDRIAEAVEMIRQEWTDMAANGVSEAELARAKTYLTGAYPLRFDGNGQIARILVGMQMDDLPIDYIATRNDRINAVTLDEANRVAHELLRPDQLRFVVVGQPEGLDEARRVEAPE